jgi:hypothetical protein
MLALSYNTVMIFNERTQKCITEDLGTDGPV